MKLEPIYLLAELIRITQKVPSGRWRLQIRPEILVFYGRQVFQEMIWKIVDMKVRKQRLCRSLVQMHKLEIGMKSNIATYFRNLENNNAFFEIQKEKNFHIYALDLSDSTDLTV